MWAFVEEGGGWRSPIAKFLSDDERAAIAQRLDAAPGDVLFIVADRAPVAADVLGLLRLELAERFDLAARDRHDLLWVVDFPMFEQDAETGTWDPLHHPFTAPEGDLDGDPGALRSRAYDLVCDGQELGGGSIRINRADVQRKVLELLRIGPEEAQERFGFLLDALEYGAPPHGGIAFGIDRIVALIAGRESIREVIPFPKTASGIDPLTGAPAPVDPAQLREVGLRRRRRRRASNRTERLGPDGGEHGRARALDRAVEHVGRERQRHLAADVEREQAHLAAEPDDLVEHRLGRAVERVAGAQPRGHVVPGDGADDGLAVAGGRDRAARVGVGAGPDQRRVADAARRLVAGAAGRGRGGEVARVIEGNRADGAKRRRRLLDHVVGRVDHGGARLLRDRLRAGPDHQHVLGVLEHGAGGLHRVAHARHGGHGAGATGGAVHDGGVELGLAAGVEHGATSGVVARAVLERHHRGLGGVQRAAAAVEHRPAGVHRRGEVGARALGVEGPIARAPSGAPMDSDDHRGSSLSLPYRVVVWQRTT